MKKSIRFGVFETNSSSTHSITMCSAEDYKKWEDGETLFNSDYEEFLTREQAIEKLKNNKYYKDIDFTDEDTVNEALRDNYIYTSDEYWEDERLEGYEDSFTTKSGDKVVAFGKYGMDN